MADMVVLYYHKYIYVNQYYKYIYQPCHDYHYVPDDLQRAVLHVYVYNTFKIVK